MEWVSPPRRRVAVLVPGTGSDAEFVRRAFAGPLAALGFRLVAVSPRPGPRLVDEHLAALDRAALAAGHPVVVGGVSLGAHLAAEWAARNPGSCAGLLLAMPGWTGPAGEGDDAAPAALAALASAGSVDRLGLEAALRAATDGVPDWLAEELDRSWRWHGTGLADSLRAAARHPAPDVGTLRRITAPAAVVCCVDDPVHPREVAERWAAALPNAERESITLDALGADRESLGRAAVLALLRAARRR
ncbi:Lysophospholipase, alpha-beta hydrolase superfamily [Streptoalloteichus tenebrarius]|uniref:Lysophospholipase, alpha-beta hydrolase superfamily n=1 Tax=Streptoalloteichus tenebrarius (strain ATCC 17920 / DSM 40477 / JCM 4838 / CBS 697.72 / NBRC 16177 / NCIMB 11028 / NRRL B-12390 / A12253. 1 / ISP 5477) TaxID=1933 RepID=A0ABT1HZG5_STRSD|nr:alpha/beta hydrolase [Streptoalloteichus tenebrarius]MCP2260750.1 Lysophospholipase, alpha-beta hydrolase superfamily [Streptoalloteichus tenebrarius]BFF03437.1 thioesterase [Streptoalloteichus tenebrarius]